MAEEPALTEPITFESELWSQLGLPGSMSITYYPADWPLPRPAPPSGLLQIFNQPKPRGQRQRTSIVARKLNQSMATP
jgi:hypothetical protein